MIWWSPARRWLLDRTVRERWMLAFMTAVTLPFLAFMLVYQPLMERLDAAKQRHVAAVQRHGAVLAQLAQLAAAPSATSSARGGAPLSIRITDAAARAKIRLTSNESRGASTAVISVAPSSTTETLRWLRQLEATGVGIRELTIAPQGNGMAVVTATLAERTIP